MTAVEYEPIQTGNTVPTVILGSRSPRRRELLTSVVGATRLRILPPESSDELSFDDLATAAAIEQRLLKVVMLKHQDVSDQLERPGLRRDPDWAAVVSGEPPAIVVADTLVIAATADGQRLVLGQPALPDWQADVRRWLRQLLSGTTHSVWTGFCVSRGAEVRQHIVCSEVSFVPLTDALIEWYVATGESPGKAGGYAIQGQAAALVCGLQGSLTNVIGLPLLEVTAALQALGVECAGGAPLT